MVTNSLMNEVIQTSPYWELETYSINQSQKQIDLKFKLKDNAQFKCPVCTSKNIKFQHEEQREFRYLPLLDFQTYIHASRIWVVCPEHGTSKIEFPWEEKLAEILKNQILC